MPFATEYKPEEVRVPVIPQKRSGVFTVYYAHPVSLYGTEQEVRDITTLGALGFQVVNPNDPQHQAGYEKQGMGYFFLLVEMCDAVAFRSFPDGSIGAGIAKEIDMAGDRPIIELPSGVLRRTLSVEETREALREGGSR